MTKLTPDRDYSNEPAHWRQESDANDFVWLCLDKADGSANVLSGSVLWQLNDILEPCLPNVERARIPSASHGLEMENPTAFNETVLGFLARQ